MKLWRLTWLTSVTVLQGLCYHVVTQINGKKDVFPITSFLLLLHLYSQRMVRWMFWNLGTDDTRLFWRVLRGEGGRFILSLIHIHYCTVFNGTMESMKLVFSVMENINNTNYIIPRRFNLLMTTTNLCRWQLLPPRSAKMWRSSSRGAIKYWRYFPCPTVSYFSIRSYLARCVV